jgi:cytochrome c oxidase assembly protein subunit 15
MLLALLCLQVGIGLAIVALQLPLYLAVAHNAGAALLVMSMVVINFRLFPAPRASVSPGSA